MYNTLTNIKKKSNTHVVKKNSKTIFKPIQDFFIYDLISLLVTILASILYVFS